MARKWWCFILLIVGFPLYANTDSAGKDTIRYESVSLSNTQIRHIHSKSNGVDYKLYINIPASYYTARNKRYATLYLLDADYSFALAKQISEHLSDRGRINEILLVGIAYDGANQYRLNRTRDYTISRTMTGGYSPEIQQYSGGAPAFLRFIKEELVPYIDSSFPVNGSRGIVGHSLGGLFALDSLLEAPDLFDNYIIISASLWYDNERLMKSFASKKNMNQTVPHQLYMAIGGEENGGSYRMVDEQKEFLDDINKKPHNNLFVTSQIFEHFDHDMIVPAALSRGLVVLYGGMKNAAIQPRK